MDFGFIKTVFGMTLFPILFMALGFAAGVSLSCYHFAKYSNFENSQNKRDDNKDC